MEHLFPSEVEFNAERKGLSILQIKLQKVKRGFWRFSPSFL